MAAIIFTDGVRVEAPTWEDLEKKCMDDDWNPSERSEYRSEVARRAWNWSRSAIHTDRSARTFFESMEAAGMLRIEEEA